MKRIFILVLFICGCVSQTKKELSPEFEKWAAIKSPTLGEPASIGTYQAGCIDGAQSLPLEGPGFYVVNRQRLRYFGHPSMMAYLLELGQKIKQKKYPMMAVEDISYPRGGPFLTGHNSHQIGLDVDISLTPLKSAPQDDANVPAPSYVRERKELLTNWGKEQAQLVELAAQSDLVNRIFVAPAIKKFFCSTQPTAPWLYKIRPWWGHDDHIHVRLNCPASSPECVNQPALDPAENNCGAQLDWWYSAEADAEAKKMADEPAIVPKSFPVLPAKCENIRVQK
jgi:penicillin-insensitive murein endopeptidase